VATLTGERGVVRKVPPRNGGAIFNESAKRWDIERYWSLRCRGCRRQPPAPAASSPSLGYFRP
jgi:hypothetical protein